jgi:hypothetical protein
MVTAGGAKASLLNPLGMEQMIEHETNASLIVQDET